MAKSDLHPLAQVVIFVAKLSWSHKRATFLFACFIAAWQLLGKTFGTGLGAPLTLAAFFAAMYAAMVLGFRVNQITRTGMPAPGVIEFIRYFSAEKSKTAEIRERWEKGCAAQGVKWDGQVPKLLNPRYVAFGDVVATINPGSIYGDVRTVQNKQLQLQGILGCHDMQITETDPGKADIHLYFRKPLDSIRTVQELPWPDNDDEIAFAIDRDGKATAIKMMSTLIIGETGSGKSGTLWALLCDLVRRGVPVELYICDPKGGMEFGVLKRQLRRTEGTMIVKNFATSTAGCMELIKDFEAKMKERQEENERLGRRLIKAPTKEEPLRILIVDEFLSLPELTSKGVASPMGRIASQSRSTLMMAIGLAQGGKLNVIGDIRDLFPQSIALKTKNRHVTEAALSGSESELGAYCSTIPLDKPGTGWYRNREGVITKFRAPFVTDPDTEVIARSEIPKGMIMRRGQVADEVAIYRAWVGKILAYVGISNDPQRRRKEHIREDITDGDCPFCGDFQCHWWAKHVEGPEGRWEVEKAPDGKTRWFANEVLAKQAEEMRIKREKPLMNKIHNGDQSWARAMAAVAHRRMAEARASKPAKWTWPLFSHKQKTPADVVVDPAPVEPEEVAPVEVPKPAKPLPVIRPHNEVPEGRPAKKAARPRQPRQRQQLGPIPVPDREERTTRTRPARPQPAKKAEPKPKAEPEIIARPLVDANRHHGAE
jgi:hypothetical protein